MKYLKRSILALLIALILFFNIERLRLDEGESVVDLQSFVYALGAVVVGLTIIYPALRRASTTLTLGLWTAVYLLLKVLILPDEDHPIIGDVHIYVTLTEIAFIGILGILARNLARDLCDFEDAVENITLGDASRRVQPLEDAGEEIETELVRSRRHHRPLAVIVVEPQKESLQAALHRTVQQVQQAMMARYVFTSLGRLLAATIRRTDFVFADLAKDRFIVFCPETDLKGSLDLVDRIHAVSSTKMGITVACGIGSFPEEALTFEELVRQAESHRDTVPIQPIQRPIGISDAN